MRTIDFENDFTPADLAKALLDAGFYPTHTLEQVASGKVEDVDEHVTLDVTVDEEEVIEELGDDAIVAAYEAMGRDSGNDREIEDGLRYARAGDLGMSQAMFERVFDGADLDAVRRGLS